MARKTIEQRLAELDAQRASLKARLGKQERANDTRRPLSTSNFTTSVPAPSDDRG